MSQYQRLLLIINPALRHSQVMNHAAALAKASGASLHVCALMPSWKLLALLEEGDRKKARADYLQDHRDWLKEQAKNMRDRGLVVTTEVAWADDLQQDILDHVMEMQPDLLIKQVQHEPALKRAFFTPLDWRLLRHCPIPIYLVGEGGHAMPRKVAAAVDASSSDPQGDELNERIIKQACDLAMQCDAELHLLYACDISAAYLADMGGLTLADLTREQRRDMEKSFLKLAGRYGVSSDRRHFIQGHPVPVLSEFAHQQQVDVIVMGRVQSRGLDKLLGSTTEHILYQVPCSVLAI
ncbi:universal stress protein [Pseudomonas chlororaphis]|uniref:universal stress protein n=1 Tax=Pseudomonas chlororaphis TaxID=587753 RepID=UPI0006A57D9A|nr:universal stress protein [Pseudomonas chlororaphis]AZD02335.1 Universal stress protein family 5 [Pseudomonas chlororaphis subsp. chlororaphis]MBM0280389.1 universal stress protein [Pseudomonas chlororaphis]MDO1504971.1 universal stress protein [Pseudomonas chlororaphis]ORM44867.1 universal stress protein [Pseudomonas chlororaphis subsp. chlororaphis]TWR96091.1 universal stress protein [Pseudomonas chlororaphis subsp. chlororaphis]